MKIAPKTKKWTLPGNSCIYLLLIIYLVLSIQVLDLVNRGAATKEPEKTLPLTSLTQRSVLESLPDLWDAQSYEAEYDLDKFLGNIRT